MRRWKPSTPPNGKNGAPGSKHITLPRRKSTWSSTNGTQRNPRCRSATRLMKRYVSAGSAVKKPTRRRPLPAAIHPTKTDQLVDSAKRRARRTLYRAGNKLAPRQESFCARSAAKSLIPSKNQKVNLHRAIDLKVVPPPESPRYFTPARTSRRRCSSSASLHPAAAT